MWHENVSVNRFIFGSGDVLASCDAVFKIDGRPVAPDNQKLGWTS